MMHELIAAFDRADADDDVRAIIVTGAGRGFCAGADLSAGRAPSTAAAGPQTDPTRGRHVDSATTARATAAAA